MKSVCGISASQKTRSWCFLILLGGTLAACGGGNSGTPARPPINLPETGGGTETTYTVVNLGPGRIWTARLNTKGQVAFTPLWKGYRGVFFNGDTLRDVGTLGGRSTYLTSLNDAGQVGGHSGHDEFDTLHAIRWTEAGGMIDAGPAQPNTNAEAHAINRDGHLVGAVQRLVAPGFVFWQPYIWNQADGMADLFTVPDGPAKATLINDNGMVAGFAGPGDRVFRAFAWTRADGKTDLGLGPGDSSVAVINNAGEIAGAATVSVNPSVNHAFVWSKRLGIRDLGTLGGTESFSIDMNEAGQVAGVWYGPQDHRSFSWTRLRGMVDLGTLGGTFARTHALNDAGQVVGESTTAAGALHAFAWTAARGIVNLNERIPAAPAGLVLSGALAVANNGYIVAMSNAGPVLLKPGAVGTDSPLVGPISAIEPVQAGQPVTLSASFKDQNTADTHTAAWSWGDECAGHPGTVTETNGAGTATGTHTFCTPGVYPVALTITDSTGRSTTVSRELVVHDGSAGFVAASGWLMSPPGALAGTANHSGPAEFRFFSTDKREHAGRTAFHFEVANLSFHGGGFDTMTRDGDRVRYTGSGRMNGASGYRFALEAVDAGTANAAGTDRIHMRIWHIDPRTKAVVVDYDNMTVRPSASWAMAKGGGGAIAGGDIVIAR